MKKFFLKWGLRIAKKDAIGKFNSCRKCDVWKEPLSPTTTISEAIFFCFLASLCWGRCSVTWHANSLKGHKWMNRRQLRQSKMYHNGSTKCHIHLQLNRDALSYLHQVFTVSNILILCWYIVDSCCRGCYLFFLLCLLHLMPHVKQCTS